VVEAVNEGIRRDQRHLYIDPSIVQIRTVVQLTPVSDLWTNNGVTIDANDNPALLWACLPDGTGMKHNPAWCAHYGMTDAEARNGWKYTAHPDDSSSLLEPWLRSLKTSEPYEVEVRRRDLTGEYRWYRTFAVPVFHNGRLVKWCGVNILQNDRTTRPNMMDGPLWWRRFAHTSKAKVLRA
jgi:PAS domain S-box-containing protein